MKRRQTKKKKTLDFVNLKLVSDTVHFYYFPQFFQFLFVHFFFSFLICSFSKKEKMKERETIKKIPRSETDVSINSRVCVSASVCVNPR